MTHSEIIDDLHKRIHEEWPTDQINEFFLGPYVGETMIQYHHSLGRWIRNHYNLWSIPWEPEIKDLRGCLCDCSPYHPDQVSYTIIQEVWKKGPISNEILEQV